MANGDVTGRVPKGRWANPEVTNLDVADLDVTDLDVTNPEVTDPGMEAQALLALPAIRGRDRTDTHRIEAMEPARTLIFLDTYIREEAYWLP